MKTTEQDYTPFGEEWEKEIIKLQKKLITERLKKSLLSQQWISVNDELPAVGETVLLKFENNEEHVTTGIYIKSFHGDCAYQESGEQCTHWRPIERK